MRLLIDGYEFLWKRFLVTLGTIIIVLFIIPLSYDISVFLVRTYGEYTGVVETGFGRYLLGSIFIIILFSIGLLIRYVVWPILWITGVLVFDFFFIKKEK